MLNSVILVLREVLEAALIVSLLLALTRKLQIKTNWAVLATAIGGFGSWLLASYAYDVANMFDGTGQELLNSTLLLVAIASVSVLGVMIAPRIYTKSSNNTSVASRDHFWIYLLSIVAVGCAMTREGSEILIYLSSFMGQADVLSSAILGGAIGAGIGISIGAIVYYFLIFMPERNFFVAFILISALFVGSQAMQTAKELMQIGWLESGQPMWDSSWIISEQSLSGEFMYALLGYEAKPTLIQGIFYLLSVIPLAIAVVWFGLRKSQKS